MHLFSRDPDARTLAEHILRQPHPMETLFLVLKELQPGMRRWFVKSAYADISGRHFTGVSIADTLWADIYLPGDILIFSTRAPSIGDVIEYGLRIEQDEYETLFGQVTALDFRNGVVSVVDLYEKNWELNISPRHVIAVLDRVIPFGTEEWDRMVDFFGIDVSRQELIIQTRMNIECLEIIERFYNKEENLNKLKRRLAAIEAKPDRRRTSPHHPGRDRSASGDTSGNP
ncbi:MAG TPA: hypothetical protein ENN85_02825 [Methanoculleus sp.]|nr:hypothetical protein [Methanoculleus sp.]